MNTDITAHGFVMPTQTVNVFVSYSHADTMLVAPIVKLLRVNKSLVFQDTDRITPGKRWRDEIARALAEANLVVVFWCDHASRSAEVSMECKAAIEQEKDLLPLLLDATPLPPELGEFQWIDFRGTVGAHHSSIDSVVGEFPNVATPPTMEARSRHAFWYTLAGVSVAAAAVLVYLSTSGPPSPLTTSLPPLPPAKPVPSIPSPPPTPDALSIGIILPLLVVGAFLLWLLTHIKRKRLIEKATLHPSEIERRVAVVLEAEILRRITSTQDGEA